MKSTRAALLLSLGLAGATIGTAGWLGAMQVSPEAGANGSTPEGPAQSPGQQPATAPGSGTTSRQRDAQPTGPYSQPDGAKRAEAYFNFTMGHLSEEQYEASGKPEYASQAIDYYKKALAIDPSATDIVERLAEIYAKSQRIRDAVTEAQNVLKADPDNLGAHRLLARIYVRTLGDLDSSARQKDTISKAVEQLNEVLRLDPMDTESALWLARLYRFQNEHDKAEEVLRRLLNRNPDSEAGLEQLSQLLIDENRAPEAIALLEEAQSRSPSPGISDLLGEAYSQAHDYPKAEKAYRTAVEEEPEDANHRRGLAQTLLAENKYKEALAQFKKLTEIDPDNAENYLRMSQIYRHLGQLDQAESAMAQSKQRAPASLEVLYNEAQLYDAQGRYDDAIHILSDAIAGVKSQTSSGEQEPNALGILYEQLGRVYRDKEDYSNAIRTFEELKALGPENQRRGQEMVIDTYRAARDIDHAIAEAQKAMNADPKEQEWKVTYAMLLGEKGQTDEAAKVLRGMLQGKDSDRETYLNLAQVEERGRQYAEAEQAAKQAEQLSRDSSEKEMAWFMLGAIYERQKKYDPAEEEFRRVLGVNPRNAPVLNYYGYMLADRGVRLDEATTLVKRALAEDATNGAYLDSLGWAYYKQNRLAEAEEYLRKAVERDGHDPTILDHLGDVEAKLGRSDRATELWEKSLAEWQKSMPADYEAERVNDLDKKLKNMRHRLAQKGAANEAKPQ